MFSCLSRFLALSTFWFLLSSCKDSSTTPTKLEPTAPVVSETTPEAGTTQAEGMGEEGSSSSSAPAWDAQTQGAVDSVEMLLNSQDLSLEERMARSVPQQPTAGEESPEVRKANWNQVTEICRGLPFFAANKRPKKDVQAGYFLVKIPTRTSTKYSSLDDIEIRKRLQERKVSPELHLDIVNGQKEGGAFAVLRKEGENYLLDWNSFRSTCRNEYQIFLMEASEGHSGTFPINLSKSTFQPDSERLQIVVQPIELVVSGTIAFSAPSESTFADQLQKRWESEGGLSTMATAELAWEKHGEILRLSIKRIRSWGLEGVELAPAIDWAVEDAVTK